jgi:hypothetical protein
LAKYLNYYRPLLAGHRYRGDRVWVSMHSIGRYGGGPSIRSSCGSQKKPSVGAFLRIYCLATSLAIHDPAIVNIAHVMLGNSLATTERFYNLAHKRSRRDEMVNRALTSLRGRLQAKGL